MAQPRYYPDDEMADERQPLGSSMPPSPPRHRQQYQQQPYNYHQEHYNAPASQYRPAAHPDSSFDRLRAQRRYSREPPNGGRGVAPYATAAVAPSAHRQADAVSPASPPQSYPQRDQDGRYWGQGTSYPPPAQHQRPSPPSNITPGADNFSNAAAGGMAGIALTVAEQNARESGLNALHGHPVQASAGQVYGESGRLAPQHDYYAADRNSHSSLQGLSSNGGGGPSTGYATPGQRTPSRLGPGDIYSDDPYQNLSRHQDSTLGVVNPNDIADDGDDGLEYGRRGPRTSMLSLGSSHKGAAAAGGAAAGGVLGGLVGRNGSGSLSHNQYAPVNNGVISDRASGNSGSGSGFGGPGTGAGAGMYHAGPAGADMEKPAAVWQAGAASKTSSRGKKWRIAIIVIVLLAIIAGIVLGVLFGAVFKNKGGSGGSTAAGDTSTASGDTAANGDLGAESAEIQSLLNNPDLRKVFPGIDYTPLNTQYPDCVKNPASQNNVTRDLAVLSQLTNVVRLYGTDCNQTEMLVHAVDRLNLKGKIKIWLGVWQDNDATTNARQLQQMWDILDRFGADYFRGVIVANEILFRQQMTPDQLTLLLTHVRANMTARGLSSLHVATSDLGDLWDEALAKASDAIMGNIHPFFAGTPAATAADWTRYFWGNKTGTFLKSDKSMNIISETGWPSQGGMSCGGDGKQTVCPDASVAGIEQLNTFMQDWVCRALEDGQNYFWFEAFDEPWKIKFDTDGKQWEDHWGLLTVDRKLKEGVKIPDCGGKRVS